MCDCGTGQGITALCFRGSLSKKQCRLTAACSTAQFNNAPLLFDSVTGHSAAFHCFTEQCAKSLLRGSQFHLCYWQATALCFRVSLCGVQVHQNTLYPT